MCTYRLNKQTLVHSKYFLQYHFEHSHESETKVKVVDLKADWRDCFPRKWGERVQIKLTFQTYNNRRQKIFKWDLIRVKKHFIQKQSQRLQSSLLFHGVNVCRKAWDGNTLAYHVFFVCDL